MALLLLLGLLLSLGASDRETDVRARPAVLPSEPDWPTGQGVTGYRTKAGRTHFDFRFDRQSDGSIRIYIIRQPPYGHRAQDAESTHRLGGPGHYFICWDT